MAQTDSRREPDATAQDGGHWWSSRRAGSAIFAASVLLLELLPLQAALLLVTAGAGSPIGDEPISPVINAVLLVALWAVGAVLRPVPTSTAFAMAVPFFAGACLLALLTSPSAYAGSGNGFAALVGDLSSGSSLVTADAGIATLALFISWRGFTSGSTPPSSSSVSWRFKIGLGVILLAVAAASVIHNAERGPLLGALAVLLPVEVFCGLMASALARIQRERLRSGVVVAPGIEGGWLGAALGLAGIFVGVTLALSLVINYGSVGALLARLGPVGSALDALARGVGTLLGLLLYVVFNGLFEWLRTRGFHVNLPGTRGSSSRCPPGTLPPRCTRGLSNTPPPEWMHAAVVLGQIVALVVVVAVALWLLRRLIAGRRRVVPVRGSFEEQRESLDATALLRAQLRALLDGLRRPPAVPDPLTPGTVRYLYRDVLRSAAHAGAGRAPSETPDEFAPRATRGIPLARGEQDIARDMAALTEAYDAVRYAEREPEPAALGILRAAARRLTGVLRRQWRG